MDSYKSIILKIFELELLLIIFFTVNGAYVSIMMPTNPVLHYIGILAFGDRHSHLSRHRKTVDILFLSEESNHKGNNDS